MSEELCMAKTYYVMMTFEKVARMLLLLLLLLLLLMMTTLLMFLNTIQDVTTMKMNDKLMVQ
jgi:hypothetical protein